MKHALAFTAHGSKPITDQCSLLCYQSYHTSILLIMIVMIMIVIMTVIMIMTIKMILIIITTEKGRAARSGSAVHEVKY